MAETAASSRCESKTLAGICKRPEHGSMLRAVQIREGCIQMDTVNLEEAADAAAPS